jgi:hypothetical protein
MSLLLTICSSVPNVRRLVPPRSLRSRQSGCAEAIQDADSHPWLQSLRTGTISSPTQPSRIRVSASVKRRKAKFGQHLHLNRLRERFAQEGIELDTSILVDWVGACTTAQAQLVDVIRGHMLAHCMAMTCVDIR